ncbi:MAG TPA: dihydrofolate reductase family protein [Thermoanaerobaculia bacterium]|nr:dihydrofolate reductase family protein [Thermoanaerobaculia bacterium]
MSRIVAIEHVTLDGVMQSPARRDEDARDGFDRGGWAIPRSHPMMQTVAGKRMGNAWSLLAGRKTYVDFADVWPKRAGDSISEALNRVRKFVVSTTLSEPLGWQNSTLLKSIDAVAKLKDENDETLVIFGSGVLVQSLMQRDLVDEFVLQNHPVILGKGRRLFAGGMTPREFTLVEAVTTPTGVVIATYARV